jgi:membrane-associated phospholipid phosphatase
VRFHYVTDTLAGAAVGIGTVCGLALGISHFRRPGWASRRDGRQADGAGHEVAR